MNINSYHTSIPIPKSNLPFGVTANSSIIVNRVCRVHGNTFNLPQDASIS